MQNKERDSGDTHGSATRASSVMSTYVLMSAFLNERYASDGSEWLPTMNLPPVMLMRTTGTTFMAPHAGFILMVQHGERVCV